MFRFFILVILVSIHLRLSEQQNKTITDDNKTTKNTTELNNKLELPGPEKGN